MSPRLACVTFLLLAACVAPIASKAAPASSAESQLATATFTVGFRYTWALDEGRTYRTTFDDGKTYGADKSPRPVLILLWYPADPAAAHLEPMRHEQYFSIASEDTSLASFAPALSTYARDIFVQQVMGAAEAELDDVGRAELETALAAPTLCRAAAEPADGSFPLVVYHSGAGSSFEDNAALCEYLASRGYVVIGSAFPRADGSSLGIDAGRGSAEDVQFLVRWSRTLPFADPKHVALMGHSAGAQAMLTYAAQPGCIGDALVLLDTTQDYYAPGMPLHESLVSEATKGVPWLTRPMLVAASPQAIFALCDTLVNAERTYLTVPELAHDEFISQGLQRLARITQHQATAPPGGDAADATEAARAADVTTQYRALCETVRSFLDAEIGGRSADFAARISDARSRPWSPDVQCLVRVPKGVSAPEPYDTASSWPPSPREFRQLLEARGVEAACAVLVRFKDAEPRGPLYTNTMMAGSLLHGLMQSGRRDDAARYYATLKQLSVPVLGLFSFLADISRMQQKPAQALMFLSMAHDLDPDDAEIAAKLRELEGQRVQ